MQCNGSLCSGIVVFNVKPFDIPRQDFFSQGLPALFKVSFLTASLADSEPFTFSVREPRFTDTFIRAISITEPS